MKLMNEIESPSSGKIVKILGAEGQVVEFGEVLFLIDPAG
jgi:biotin carboxyl carrier protein